MTTGIELIRAERQRQVESEGWTPEHDDSHDGGQLALAAICYASEGGIKAMLPRPCGCREVDCGHWNGEEVEWRYPWPFDSPIKKSVRIKDLAKAGALIAAEIDRLQRKAEAKS